MMMEAGGWMQALIYSQEQDLTRNRRDQAKCAL
jgi:hypothetical protein